MIRTNCAKGRDTSRTAFFGAMKNIFELTNLVAAVLGVGDVVVFDQYRVRAPAGLESNSGYWRRQIGECLFSQPLGQLRILGGQEVGHGQRLSKCTVQRE